MVVRTQEWRNFAELNRIHHKNTKSTKERLSLGHEETDNGGGYLWTEECMNLRTQEPKNRGVLLI
jgi:hypothetical protein